VVVQGRGGMTCCCSSSSLSTAPREERIDDAITLSSGGEDDCGKQRGAREEESRVWQGGASRHPWRAARCRMAVESSEVRRE
jgi:hypothetical protein